MKKLINSSITFVLLIFMVSFNGCDELQTLPLNIPFKINFSSSTNNNSTFDDASFCLNGSDEWNENVDNIKSAKFISAGIWFETGGIDGTTPGLTGNVRVTLKQGGSSGPTLFSFTIPNTLVTNFVNNGLVLSLEEAQIQAVNAYLESFKNAFDKNLCFYTSVEVLNITGQGPPFRVKGRLEMVIEAEVEF